MFNRFKLGRTLDEVHGYGCDLLFSELALAVCAQEGIAQRFYHLDTTSFSLSGDYVPESDEQAITITHGYGTAQKISLPILQHLLDAGYAIGHAGTVAGRGLVVYLLTEGHLGTVVDLWI